MSSPLRSISAYCTTVAALLIMSATAPELARAGDGVVAVDDTDMDAVGECKLDSWMSVASNRDAMGVMSPGCVFDFGRPVDVTFGFQRSRADGDWSTSGGVKLRTLIVPGGVGQVSVLLAVGTAFDFENGELSNLLLQFPVSFHARENLRLNVNGGWLYDHEITSHWAAWGASFDWAVNDRLSLIGEVFGQFGQNVWDTPHLNETRAQLAVRLKPNENVDFDVIYGRNITGENAHWITLGINVRFNAFGARVAEPPAIRRPLIRK